MAFFVLLLCGFGVPIPEDITLFAMGILSYYGLVDLNTAIIVCFAGVMIGDISVFLLGKHYGIRIAQKGIFSNFFHPERIEKTRELVRKYGNKVIFAARFIPGLRSAMFFSAGTFKMRFWVFLLYDGLAALLSVPLLVGATFYFGDQLHKVIQIARSVQHGILALIVAIVLFFVLKHYVTLKLKKRRSS